MRLREDRSSSRSPGRLRALEGPAGCSRFPRAEKFPRCAGCAWLPGTVAVMTSVEAARVMAETELVGPLSSRWPHVRSVARRARWAAKTLALFEHLVAAAWLHDIGCASDLVQTGFHPLDSARYLRRASVNRQVVSLVAYHSCAEVEADVLGLLTFWHRSSSPENHCLLMFALLRHDDRAGRRLRTTS
jgi:hypothetical protein